MGVLRALAEFEIEAMVLPNVDRIAKRSRWYRPAPHAFDGLRPDELASRLETLPTGTVLIPCSDQWTRTVGALPADTRLRYPASIAPLAALDLLVDKAGFRATLERLGLPHPTTRVLNSITDLEAVPDSVLQSSFLKPVHSQQFFARFGVKAFRVAGKPDARNRLDQCIDAGMEMMLQEYIPGPPTNHYFIDGFVDRHGVVRAMFARRRLRMSPPDFGNSTLMVTVQLSETGDAPSTLKRLFTDIKYRGVFSAEFKRDARDGVFNLIEVNARPWWYVEFAARCGVNVCKMAVDDALGRPVATIERYALGRQCVFPYYDLAAVRTERAAGRLGLIEWARSWLGPYQPVFRWSDPLPAVGEVLRLAADSVRKRATRRRT